jgi:hypothetical protein
MMRFLRGVVRGLAACPALRGFAILGVLWKKSKPLTNSRRTLILLRTKEGVVVHKDWSPTRIGRAYTQKPPTQSDSYSVIQEALLAKPKAALPNPRPVAVHPNVEQLVRFFT